MDRPSFVINGSDTRAPGRRDYGVLLALPCRCRCRLIVTDLSRPRMARRRALGPRAVRVAIRPPLDVAAIVARMATNLFEQMAAIRPGQTAPTRPANVVKRR